MILNCLWVYNFSTGYYTATGKRVNKPSSKATVSDRLKYQWRHQPTPYQWEAFFRHELLLYGYNSPNFWSRYALVMIDLDALNGADLREFAKIVEEVLGFKIYWEVSPSGGWHGYFFLLQEGAYPEHVNKAFDNLDQRLKALVVKHGWGDRVKETTVKGKLPIIDWEGRDVLKQFALFQLPNQVRERTEEFLSTSVVHFDHFTTPDFLKISERYFGSKIEQPKIQQGSTGFLCVDEEDLEQLPNYRRMVERNALSNIRCSNRDCVT